MQSSAPVGLFNKQSKTIAMQDRTLRAPCRQCSRARPGNAKCQVANARGSQPFQFIGTTPGNAACGAVPMKSGCLASASMKPARCRGPRGAPCRPTRDAGTRQFPGRATRAPQPRTNPNNLSQRALARLRAPPVSMPRRLLVAGRHPREDLAVRRILPGEAVLPTNSGA
jgi:hypothetical protein